MSNAPLGFSVSQPWPSVIRRLAVVLWCGFLGAILMLLCLLMAWEYLWPNSADANWTVLAAVFLMAWVSSALAVMFGLSLAATPGPQLLEDSQEASRRGAASDDHR